MPSSKKEKHYPNSRARRHSGTVVISHSSKKSKKDKDTDSESTTSTASSDAVVVPPPSPKKCPLRFVLASMMESESEEQKTRGCPLRRVQLWHTIPLCLLAIVNLLLVIIALLGLAVYRILQALAPGLTKPVLDFNPYADSIAGTDDTATSVSEKT